MTLKLVVISGGIASGKSSLSKAFEKELNFRVIRTSDLILERLPGTPKDRQSMQRAGNRLDRQTSQAWIANDMARMMREEQDDDRLFVLDGVRKRKQMENIQQSIGHRYVRHIHLHASESTQRKRYENSRRDKDEGLAFEEAINDASEKDVRRLVPVADIVIDIERYTQRDVFAHASSRLNLHSRSAERLVDVIIGGQYGSEGKGNIADYLSPEYSVLMRVGGPNAGHIVYEEPPYTHISLPCGTRRNDNAQILIGPGAVINPDTLIKEIRECEVEPGRLIVDEGVALICQDDIDWEAEHLKDEIGSTANGVGVAAARRIRDRFRDDRACRLGKDIRSTHPELVPYFGSTHERLERAYSEGERILLEGTQGTGLSMFHGDYPSVTSRDTTAAGCLSEAGIGPRRVRKVVMVCRSYPIRVGGESGDFSKEISWDIVSERSNIPVEKLKGHEIGSRSGKGRRVGEFDWHMLRRSCHLNSPTDIALTFSDYLSISNQEATRFEQLTSETINFVEEVELVSGVPCSLIANRFNHKCVIDRRRW
jgi:adenylosuccinate synthase